MGGQGRHLTLTNQLYYYVKCLCYTPEKNSPEAVIAFSPSRVLKEFSCLVIQAGMLHLTLLSWTLQMTEVPHLQKMQQRLYNGKLCNIARYYASKVFSKL